ncbi:unnamed protein product [Lathyrus oleraceus]
MKISVKKCQIQVELVVQVWHFQPQLCVSCLGLSSFCYCDRQLVALYMRFGLWRVIGCGSLMGSWISQMD